MLMALLLRLCIHCVLMSHRRTCSEPAMRDEPQRRNNVLILKWFGNIESRMPSWQLQPCKFFGNIRSRQCVIAGYAHARASHSEHCWLPLTMLSQKFAHANCFDIFYSVVTHAQQTRLTQGFFYISLTFLLFTLVWTCLAFGSFFANN